MSDFESDQTNKLVFILGAGRSGTNLLTFAFDAESPDFGNLGENRYVWTKGQRNTSDDRRTVEEITTPIRRYVRRHFAMRMRRFNGSATVFLDKTPSNAFRIPFAAEIFPDAKFIHIIRDGRDNLLSRSRQWKSQEPGVASSSEPMSRLWGRLRYFRQRFATLRLLLREGSLPLDRTPAILRESLHRQFMPLLMGRPVMYGERVPGLDKILNEEGVDAAAIVQWRESVLAARRDGDALGEERYLELKYENFIADPISNWHGILRFLGRTPTGEGDLWLSQNVMPSNSQKWLAPDEIDRIAKIEPHLRPVLESLGYDW